MNKDFLRGFGSIIKLLPNNKGISSPFPDFIRDDAEALKSDWSTVGITIIKAAGRLTKNGEQN
ncbi:MAG TPA: hypothetical protein VD770_00930 [Coxiellaceae bacterium]|nr:hypothetical protein [Coxiellaceae bacterium]